MTNYIIQNPTLDFARTLIESIKFDDWKSQCDSWLSYSVSNKCDVDDIPVGTVEWALDILKNVHHIDYQPFVMSQFFFDSFGGRNMFYGNKSDIPKNWFYKEANKLKGEIGFQIFGVDKLPDVKYIISEPVDFESEYRVFVYEKNVVGLKHYLGNFWQFPNKSEISKMIEEFINQPVAYTLDIGILDGKTCFIEINDFFSCGLYGWEHYAYPRMLRDRFKQIISNKN